MKCYKPARLELKGSHSVKGQGLVCCHTDSPPKEDLRTRADQSSLGT